MRQLVSAIQTAFSGNPAFSVFPKGLENCEGADLEALPNLILVQVSAVNDYSTRSSNGIGVVETCNLQFTIRSSDGSQVAKALDDIDAMLDHKPLVLGGGQTLLDARPVSSGKIVKEDEKVYRGDTEYRFMVCRTIQ